MLASYPFYSCSFSHNAHTCTKVTKISFVKCLKQHTEQQTQEHTFYGYQMVAVCKLSHKVTGLVTGYAMINAKCRLSKGSLLYNHKIISFPNLSYTNASFLWYGRVMGIKILPGKHSGHFTESPPSPPLPLLSSPPLSPTLSY